MLLRAAPSPAMGSVPALSPCLIPSPKDPKHEGLAAVLEMSAGAGPRAAPGFTALGAQRGEWERLWAGAPHSCRSVPEPDAVAQERC